MISEKQPEFNPEGVLHGPHKPLELYEEGAVGRETAETADVAAEQGRRDTRWSMSYDVLRLAGLSNGEDFRAENTLRDALYQDEMNKAAIIEAHTRGDIDDTNKRAGRRAIRDDSEKHSEDYWNKMHALAGDEDVEAVDKAA